MAVASKKSNVSVLADTNTFSGPGKFKLLLIGGSAASTLSLSIGGTELIALAAAIGDSVSSPCVQIDTEEVTVALAGAGAKAFAIWE